MAWLPGFPIITGLFSVHTKAGMVLGILCLCESWAFEIGHSMKFEEFQWECHDLAANDEVLKIALPPCISMGQLTSL